MNWLSFDIFSDLTFEKKKNEGVDNELYGLIGIKGQILDVMEGTAMEILPKCSIRQYWELENL